MLSAILAIILLTAESCRGQAPSVLLEFQERFANHSQAVQPEIHAFMSQNNEARLQLIDWIVREIGNLTVDMRRITNEAKAAIEANELLNDDCRDVVQDSFEFYVMLGAMDIMYCAFDMDYYMRYDGMYRFQPSVRVTNRKNARALSQTVQTLGEVPFVGQSAEVTLRLGEELTSYETHWEKYQKILFQEIDDIRLLEDLVQDEMEWWYNYAIYWHLALMQTAVDAVDVYCT